MGAWEYLTHGLATRAGIEMPRSKRLQFGADYHTYCVQRFDRRAGRRSFPASAMALLRKDHSEGTSYLELAEILHHRGAPRFIRADLEQLFRRVVFNVAVGNRDDQLRNHGFVLRPEGWRLSPAFDLNPNPEKADHVLNLDETDNRPDLGTVIGTCEWYQLSKDRAAHLVTEIVAVTRTWRQAAAQAGIARADVELTATAFRASDSPGIG